MTNRVGQQLGNYKLIRPLGQGGFADVYLGEHIYLKTQAAIKVLQMRLTGNDMQSFLSEAQIIARLRHNNIIRVLEFGVEQDNPYLVMDYAPKGTLRDRHPRGEFLSLATILPYVKQIAAALQYAHDQKLIHRDVKPANFLLGANDEVLLSDFGIATLVQDSLSIETGQGGVAGTIPYMAPEQIQGKARPATDQYALGVIVYEWLCGRPPFRGSFAEIAVEHMQMEPPSLRKQVSSISSDLEAVVFKALVKAPQERFATVQAFADALDYVYQHERPTLPFNKITLSAPASPFAITDVSQFVPDEEKTRAQLPSPTQSIEEFVTIQLPANPPQVFPSTVNAAANTLFKACPFCGTNNNPDDTLCLKCGNLLMLNTASQEISQVDPTSPGMSSPPSPYNLGIAPQSAQAQPPSAVASDPWAPRKSAPTYDSCPYCGAECRPGDNFCLNCGNRLTGDANSPQNSAAENPTYQAAYNDPGTIGTHFAPNWATVVPVDQWEPSIIAPPIPLTQYSHLTQGEIKERLLREADEHYKAARYKDAVAVYQSVIQMDVQDVYVYGKKGNALGKLGRTKEALDAYTTALKIDEKHGSLWSSKGDMLAKLRAYDEALLAYNRALELESTDAITWAHKGNLLHKLKNYQEAVVAYSAALALNPRDVYCWTAKGNALFSLERYDEALIAYTCSLDYAPKKAANWEAKGDALSKLKRYAEALLAYERANILNPNKSTLRHKCDMHRELKRRQEELESKVLEEEERKRRQEELDKKRPLVDQEHKRQQQEDFRTGTTRFSYRKRGLRPRDKPDATQRVKVFDVFLSYSQEDAPWVEDLARDLVDEGGFQVWLDKWVLIAGKPWLSAKAEAIEQARACVVCIGAETPVSWFEQEIQKAINRQATDSSFSVIPILLPTAKILLPGTENEDMKAKMKNFLELNTWIDFRKFDYEYAFHYLVSGIEGKPPGRWPPEEANSVTRDLQAERKLRLLRRFKMEGIVDESLVVGIQLQILNKFFLSTEDSADE